MSGRDAVISAEGLSKRYRLGQIGATTLRESFERWTRSLRGGASVPGPDGEIWALRDVSFEVGKGEVLGIVGRNGAGKSTLLKLLTGITEPTRGRAVIEGRVGSLLEVGTGFHPELTGRENVYLNGAILGMRRREIDRKFDEIVDFSGVEPFLDTPLKRYSSGMRVRLAFGVAAHLDPEILLIDEVLAVGDAAFQKKCLGKMDDIARQGRTVLFVSHNLNAVNRLCPRAILLSEGRIAVHGPTQEVLRAYLKENAGEGRSQASFRDDPDKPYQLLAASVRREDGGLITDPIEVDVPFVVHLTVRLRRKLPGGYAAISLRNQNAETIFMSLSNDSGGSFRLDEAGTYEVRVRVPAPLFVPGRYTITAAIALHGKGSVDARADAVSLELVDLKGARSSRIGYMYIPLEWSAEPSAG